MYESARRGNNTIGKGIREDLYKIRFIYIFGTINNQSFVHEFISPVFPVFPRRAAMHEKNTQR